MAQTKSKSKSKAKTKKTRQDSNFAMFRDVALYFTFGSAILLGVFLVAGMVLGQAEALTPVTDACTSAVMFGGIVMGVFYLFNWLKVNKI
ncbi:MAG: hypothetical protein WCI47_02155 [bacterium]